MMPRYEYLCKECEVSWEIEEELGKAPKSNDCPLCNKNVARYYGNHDVGISFKDNGCGNHNSNAGDFHTVKRRYDKFNEKGYDKTAGDKFLKRSINETEGRIVDRDSWATTYKPMKFNYEKMAEDGLARKLSDEEVAKKVKTAKKLTEDAYDKADNLGYDINITDQNINKQS